MRMRGAGALVLATLCVGTTTSAEAATPATDRWLPNAEGATWTYGWSDNAYSNVTTLEQYTVTERTDQLARLSWTTEGLGNPEGSVPSAGSIDYRYAATGLFNINWSSTPPPPQFPVLCATAQSCGNSLASSHYQFIWGSRTPVLPEVLRKGQSWTSTGGLGNDVSAVNTYKGTERVVVPAFPLGVLAAKVESEITQAGAIGDPYGSGLRTTWWVYGVGPVRSAFRHAGGELSVVDLQSTSLRPKQAPSDLDHLPLQRGQVMRFRWRNSKHMRTWSRQELGVAAVSGRTVRVDVRELSGPIVVRGSYVVSTGADGVRLLTTEVQGATRAKFPALGPRGVPKAKRRTLLTPLDFLAFGFNPLLTADPRKGATWKAAATGRDRRAFGVSGSTKVLGRQDVRVPSGRYKALVLESKLVQRGFAYGSGTRRAWLAPGVGLVKLEFRHADGSVSRVERLPR